MSREECVRCDWCHGDEALVAGEGDPPEEWVRLQLTIYWWVADPGTMRQLERSFHVCSRECGVKIVEDVLNDVPMRDAARWYKPPA